MSHPSTRGHCVRARSYPPAFINPHLRLTRLRPQPRTREESTPGPMRPRLESAPIPTILYSTHVRPHSRTREESAPGPTRPCLESMLGVRARSHQSALGPTHPYPLARVRAQRGRAFTSGRMQPTTQATSAHPQSFSAGAPCSRVRPQQYINLFAPPHKSLFS
jgi:hypothetical protein